MSTPEELFMDKLAEISGAVRPHADVTAQAHAEVTKTASAKAGITKISQMSMSSMIDHPEFRAGFMDRLTERQGDLDKAAAAIALSAIEAD